MGAGHTVTALYEIVPAGGRLQGRSVDPLRYQRAVAPSDARRDGELMTIALRYKRPDGGRSQRIETVVQGDAAPLGPNLGFASAVAELGLLLTRSAHRRDGQRRSADRAGAIVHRRGPARRSCRLRHTGGTRRRLDARRACRAPVIRIARSPQSNGSEKSRRRAMRIAAFAGDPAREVTGTRLAN